MGRRLQTALLKGWRPRGARCLYRSCIALGVLSRLRPTDADSHLPNHVCGPDRTTIVIPPQLGGGWSRRWTPGFSPVGTGSARTYVLAPHCYTTNALPHYVGVCILSICIPSAGHRGEAPCLGAKLHPAFSRRASLYSGHRLPQYGGLRQPKPYWPGALVLLPPELLLHCVLTQLVIWYQSGSVIG